MKENLKKENFNKLLSNITTDLWSNINNNNYITFSIHYIKDFIFLKEHTLYHNIIKESDNSSIKKEIDKFM